MADLADVVNPCIVCIIIIVSEFFISKFLFPPPSFSPPEAPQRPDHGRSHREKAQPRAVSTEGELVTVYNDQMLHSTIVYCIHENFHRIKISPKFDRINFCQCSKRLFSMKSLTQDKN